MPATRATRSRVSLIASKPRVHPDRPGWEYERILWAQGCSLVAGVDEVGRGPLAGPVVAAAVILPREAHPDASGVDQSAGSAFPWIAELNDSKKLSERQRERLAGEIRAHSLWAVAAVSPQVVDQVNILQATRLAMKRAVDALPTAAQGLIIDGREVVEANVPQLSVVGGDGRCVSVAAASILAKVTRDRMMCELDERFPGYGLAANKGYGTAQHLAALASLGYTNIHRLSFAPVRAAVASEAG